MVLLIRSRFHLLRQVVLMVAMLRVAIPTLNSLLMFLTDKRLQILTVDTLLLSSSRDMPDMVDILLLNSNTLVMDLRTLLVVLSIHPQVLHRDTTLIRDFLLRAIHLNSNSHPSITLPLHRLQKLTTLSP